MNLKKYRPILEVVFLSILVYLAHKLVFFLNENNPKLQGFNFSIETIYEFFFTCSIIIVFVLIIVKEKNYFENMHVIIIRIALIGKMNILNIIELKRIEVPKNIH